MKYFVLSCLAVVAFSSGVASAAPERLDLMPMPAEVQFGQARLEITRDFTVASHVAGDRIQAAVDRLLRRWEARTGFTFVGQPPRGQAATLSIECRANAPAIPSLGDDESYELEVRADGAVLRSATDIGALRGLETLQQVLHSDAKGWYVSDVIIRDRPRFAWRGLLIDPCRHWLPVEVVKRTLDAMAIVKLNVLHFHLTDDQGFRIESKRYPRLHEFGSDGLYYTQEDMRELIAYAAARGIRIMPEFDVPSHTTSWLVGYPEIGSAPGPYVIRRTRGHGPVLDPTNEMTYELIEGFFGEMAELFPDAYFHIGGDENNGKHWNENPKIQAFILEHDLKDNAGLQAHFNRRVGRILAKHGKHLVGWDEILHPDLPTDSVVQSWRGMASLAEAAQRGYSAILSHGYYLNYLLSAEWHYAIDPLPENTALTPEARRRILGGEACMWGEWVTAETIDSRLWPRAAAIAERLWSPRDIRDVPDMYRRLAIISRRLDEAGLRHESYLHSALHRLAGDDATSADMRALRTFVDLVEPVKRYQRNKQQPNVTQLAPLTGLVDCARPDSTAARAFAAHVEAVVFEAAPPAETLAALATELANWRSTVDQLRSGLLITSPRLHEAVPLVDALESAARVGDEALKLLASGHVPAPEWRVAQFAALHRADAPHAAVELPFIPSLRLLVSAASEQDQRPSLSPAAWRRHLEVESRAGARRSLAARSR